MAEMAVDIQDKGGIDIEFGDMPWTLLAASERTEKAYKRFMTRLEEGGNHAGEWLEADALKSIFPGIKGDISGGLCLPQIQVEPYKYTLGLAQSAEAMGAEVRSGDIVDFDTKGGRITSVMFSSGKKIEADVVIIAMGPWSGQATSWLGNEVPVVSAMTECLRIRPKKNYPQHSILHDLEILSRVNGDIILAGAGGRTQAEYFRSKARPDFDSSLSEEVKNMNIEAAMRLLPDLLEGAELVEHRGDLLAYGPEPYYHKPVMGRLPGVDNGYIATRFGALGIQMSVGAGEVMADLIADGKVPFRAKQMLEYLSPSPA
jgi:glycine/D-amino acid oxidase-like deaminating enzyme